MPSVKRVASGLCAMLLALSAAAAAAAAAAATTAADLPQAAAADPAKVLRYVFGAAESTFDPAAASDVYSATVIESIFETLYTYDYLARPARLVPLTAQALPEISDDGRTYTIHLKRGIRYADDAAFSGKPRELTVADYVYAWKRLLDPAVRSPNAWLVEGKIVGMQPLVERARASGKMDYSAAVPGLEMPDPYTLRIHLAQADFNFGMILAHKPMAPVAREVVQAYADQNGLVSAHPVGTGPYVLTRWERGSHITLQANPRYRGFIWDFQPGPDADDAVLVQRMRGRRMPRIGRIEIAVINEEQARWLSFLRYEQDIIQLGGELAPQALLHGRLKPELAARGIQLSRLPDLELRYVYWNMQDPVVGGLAPEKIALRRAIAMAFDVEREIAMVYSGDAVRLNQPVPPGVVGHDPAWRSTLWHSVRAANLLLDRYGYRVGADGWRTLPDGSPLVVRYTATADSGGRRIAEGWKKTYDSLRIRMGEQFMPFPDILKAEKQCRLQTRTMAWIADYPDADNFMQLFYGPNVGVSNNGCQRIPAYDALYARMQAMPDGPARQEILQRMWRVLEAYTPVMPTYARYRNMLMQPRVIGFKKHPLLSAEWIYADLDNGEGAR